MPSLPPCSQLSGRSAESSRGGCQALQGQPGQAGQSGQSRASLVHSAPPARGPASPPLLQTPTRLPPHPHLPHHTPDILRLGLLGARGYVPLVTWLCEDKGRCCTEASSLYPSVAVCLLQPPTTNHPLSHRSAPAVWVRRRRRTHPNPTNSTARRRARFSSALGPALRQSRRLLPTSGRPPAAQSAVQSSESQAKPNPRWPA